jgi:hypothetical protein
MAMQIIDTRTLRDAARTKDRTIRREFGVYGRDHAIEIPITAGEIRDRPVFPAAPERGFLRKFLGPQNIALQVNAAGELLTTPPNLYAFIQKTIIDLQIGMEEVPLLYQPIYRNITDPNLTEEINVRAIISRASVVFFEHIEGEEVKFGYRALGPLETVRLITWAAGFEWTEDLVEYDKTWEVQQINEGFGRAYNALLNHLHLSPIITYPYPAKNTTDAVTADVAGTNEYRVLLRMTIQQAFQDAEADRNTDSGLGRYPTILLAHPSRRWDFEDALGRFTLNGTEYPSLAGPDTLIFYAGFSTRVGAKTYVYDGVPPDRFFLIDPSTYFVELVKHDLRVDAQPGDLSRLIAQQVVGRTRRGVFAAPEEAVQMVMMP